MQRVFKKNRYLFGIILSSLILFGCASPNEKKIILLEQELKIKKLESALALSDVDLKSKNLDNEIKIIELDKKKNEFNSVFAEK